MVAASEDLGAAQRVDPDLDHYKTDLVAGLSAAWNTARECIETKRGVPERQSCKGSKVGGRTACNGSHAQ